jgi:hypothetical protein
MPLERSVARRSRSKSILLWTVAFIDVSEEHTASIFNVEG